MITKGTENYSKAQQIANDLTRLADFNKNYNTSYGMYEEKISLFFMQIRNKGGFAAQVIDTVEKSLGRHTDRLMWISSKQSWIIACSAVENNITF